MNQRYLCVNHKQQLKNYPRQAVRAWSKSYENGQSLIAMGFAYDALAHIGCAYEAAEIVLSAKIVDTLDAVAMLTSSAATLAKLLNELGQSIESQNVINLTVQRIEREYGDDLNLKARLQNQVQSLRYFVEDQSDDEFPLDETGFSIFSFITNPVPTTLH